MTASRDKGGRAGRDRRAHRHQRRYRQGGAGRLLRRAGHAHRRLLPGRRRQRRAEGADADPARRECPRLRRARQFRRRADRRQGHLRRRPRAPLGGAGAHAPFQRQFHQLRPPRPAGRYYFNPTWTSCAGARSPWARRSTSSYPRAISATYWPGTSPAAWACRWRNSSAPPTPTMCSPPLSEPASTTGAALPQDASPSMDILVSATSSATSIWRAAATRPSSPA